MKQATQTGRGIAAGLFASFGFATMFYLLPFTAPMTAHLMWAFRVFTIVPIIAVILLATKNWTLFVGMYRHMRERPVRILGVFGCSLLMGVQLWLFMWAPLVGRGLELSLGYFLVPLVLVVLGRFVYREVMVWWQWLAVGCAACGVLAGFIMTGTGSWETVVVALGYPAYFLLRRTIRCESLGALMWEQILLIPLAIVVLALSLTQDHILQNHPHLIAAALGIGLLAGVSISMYVLSSKLLPMSFFGLLSYVEPALLVVASLLLGESIEPVEVPVYVGIWCAVIIVCVGGAVQMLRNRFASNLDSVHTSSIPIVTGSIPIVDSRSDSSES